MRRRLGHTVLSAFLVSWRLPDPNLYRHRQQSARNVWCSSGIPFNERFQMDAVQKECVSWAHQSTETCSHVKVQFIVWLKINSKQTLSVHQVQKSLRERQPLPLLAKAHCRRRLTLKFRCSVSPSAAERFSDIGLSSPFALFLLSEVTAGWTGPSVTPIARPHQRGSRWSPVSPGITLTLTAADWQSHTCGPTTQEPTAVNTPKMVQTTSPQPTSTSKVRPEK